MQPEQHDIQDDQQQQSPESTPVAQATPPTSSKGLEYVLPINRTGSAIAAGYVGLFSFPFVIVAPVALLLGIIALRSLQKNPEKRGRGRAWFAVIWGGIWTIGLVLFLLDLFVWNPGK